jgi:DNA-binding response OmpR family regulator
MKILLVDDDSFLRDMYATKFTEAGHAVEAAGSGEDAIAFLKENQVDVILLDMVMPRTTGLEVLKQIREQKLGGNPKCIVLSNQGEESDIKSATEAGAEGYIVKASMIPSEVVAKVEALNS